MKNIVLALFLVLLTHAARADVKISDLPAGTTLAGAEATPVVQSGATVKSTPAAFSTYTRGLDNTWTGINKFSGNFTTVSTASAATYIGAPFSSNPMIVWVYAAGASNEKIWRQWAGSNCLNFDLQTDAYDSANPWLTTCRTGDVTNSITFGNAGDNPTYTFAGSGAISGNGSGLTSLVGTNLTAASVSLTTKVSGILPVANGGTANAFFTVSGPASTAKTFTFPNASATVLTSNAAVTQAQGGTGLTSAADDTTLVSSGAAWVASALPNCGDSTHALAYATSTNAFSCQSVTGSGGVAGSDTQIQFNDGGAFGGDADHTWNKTTNRETVNGSVSGLDAGTVTSNGGALTIKGGTGGATSGNGGTVTLTGGDPVGSGTGGNISIFGQAGVSGNNVGSTVTIQGGTSTGSATGGNVSILAASSVTGSAGVVNITGGAGGGTSGDAGAVNISGGTAGTSGAGGSVTIAAKNGAGTNQNGGNVVVTLGNATGSGTQGTLQFVNGTTTGAQTATFVATNKPGSATGAPALWLRVVVAGVTYWIPLFAN